MCTYLYFIHVESSREKIKYAKQKKTKKKHYHYRQFFLDALPVTGTVGALQFMTKLITSKAVTGTEAEMWLTSMIFTKKPTREMLEVVKVNFT